jgi:glucokinase
VWLGNTINLLEPDVIIVGGGVAAVLQPFFDDIRERIRVGALTRGAAKFR